MPAPNLFLHTLLLPAFVSAFFTGNPSSGGVSPKVSSPDDFLEPRFEAAALLSAPGKCSSPAFADLNSDGHLDVVSIAHCIGKVAFVSLGVGDGMFGVQSPVGGFDRSLMDRILGDFDGDGATDLLFLVSESYFAPPKVEFQLARGRGDGTFDILSRYAMPGVDFRAYAWAAGDLNDDGRTDVAVLGSPREAHVYLAAPGGELVPSQVVDRGPGVLPVIPVIEDLDGDGNRDLLFAGPLDREHGVIRFFPGRGDGTFDPPEEFPTLPAVSQIAIADANRDGIADIVVGTADYASAYGGGVPGRVGFHVGRLDRAPDVPRVTDALAPVVQLSVGDIDEDGYLEACVSAEDGFSVMFLDPSGRFLPPRTEQTGPYTAFAGLIDVNSDGHLDVRVADVSSDGGIPELPILPGNGPLFLLGRGNGTFGRDTRIPVPRPARDVAIGDVSDDGRPDLLVAGLRDGAVAIFRNLGGRSFGEPHYVDVLADPRSLNVGDLNGDGLLDLIALGASRDVFGTIHPGMISISLGGGDQGFQPPWILDPAEMFSQLTLGDIDQDGDDDLLPTTAAGIRLYLGGASIVETQGTLVVEGMTALALADVNRDGFLDLVAVSGRDVAILPGRGDGTFEIDDGPRVTTDGAPVRAQVADFDGDGLSDLVVEVSKGCSYYGPPVCLTSVLLYRGEPDGRLAAPQSVTAASALAAADVTGDGRPDLVGGAFGDYHIAVLGGVPDGTLAPPRRFGLLGNLGPMRLADLDGDGRVDIAAIVLGTHPIPANHVSVLWNAGSYPTLPARVDVQPGACPNVLEGNRRGVLKVSVALSAVGLAYPIDLFSIRLNGVAPRNWFPDTLEDFEACCSSAVAGVVKEMDRPHETGRSPRHANEAWTFHFDTREVLASLDAAGGSASITLTGNLTNGAPILGEDCVLLVDHGDRVRPKR